MIHFDSTYFVSNMTILILKYWEYNEILFVSHRNAFKYVDSSFELAFHDRTLMVNCNENKKLQWYK